jgi:hypothetical protein
LEGKKHILKKQNPNFMFDNKEKTMVCKIFSIEKLFFGNFSKYTLNKKHD